MGRLTVIKTLDDGPPYRGVVPLVDGGIAADLAEYFVSSEQADGCRIGEFVGQTELERVAVSWFKHFQIATILLLNV